MAVDLSTLSYEEFELLVGMLLARSGYRVTANAGSGQRVPDFEAVAPSGDTIFVEVKHYRQPIPQAIVAQLAGDIARYRLQSPDAKGLFVVSGELSPAATARIEAHPDLDVWTGDEVIRRLDTYPDLLAAVRSTAEAFQSLRRRAKTTESRAVV